MHVVRLIEGLINTDDGINEDVQLLRSLPLQLTLEFPVKTDC